MTSGTGDSTRSSLFGRPQADVDRALPDREAVRCPLCDAPPTRFGVDYQGFHLARCRSCRLEFQSPRPVFHQLAEAVYGEQYHPAAQAEVDPVRGAQYRRQLRRLEDALPVGRRTLLDVGCGAGAFLRYATEHGWTVDGSDVAVTDWALQSGARLWEGQLPEIAFGDVRYDVVRFNHVLEHTQNPLAELRRARALVAPGGILLVGVPNLSGLSIRLKSWQSRLGLKRQAWKHYGALHHLWFFRPQTLGRIVEAAGFDVMRWETPVGDRPGRPLWWAACVKGPMELTRTGGILDLYARPRLPE